MFSNVCNLTRGTQNAPNLRKCIYEASSLFDLTVEVDVSVPLQPQHAPVGIFTIQRCTDKSIVRVLAPAVPFSLVIVSASCTHKTQLTKLINRRLDGTLRLTCCPKL